MAEYLTYPFTIMRITQNYNGTTSHKPHTTGNIKDYPIDEGGKDSGRDPIYARCDLNVMRIFGVGTKGTNTIWLESVQKVKLANGKEEYITLMLTHPNDADLKKLKEGQTIKKGEIICYEGMDEATGNHIHMSVGMGKYDGNGWVQNSNGKWVLNCTKGAIKPEDAFFIDSALTTIKDAKGLKFKELPKEEPKKTTTATSVTTTKTSTAAKKDEYTKGNYRVDTALLNVRTDAGTNCKKKLFKQLTADAQAKIKKLKGYAVDGYVKGLEFTVTSVKTVGKQHWGKTASGWVCLDYCVKI